MNNLLPGLAQRLAALTRESVQTTGPIAAPSDQLPEFEPGKFELWKTPLPPGHSSPVIVGKRQRRLSDIDTVVLSLSSRGLTSGEISAHFAEVYGASVSKDSITRITDTVLEEMAAPVYCI